jgi:hypothetical protein
MPPPLDDWAASRPGPGVSKMGLPRGTAQLVRAATRLSTPRPAPAPRAGSHAPPWRLRSVRPGRVADPAHAIEARGIGRYAVQVEDERAHRLHAGVAAACRAVGVAGRRPAAPRRLSSSSSNVASMWTKSSRFMVFDVTAGRPIRANSETLNGGNAATLGVPVGAPRPTAPGTASSPARRFSCGPVDQLRAACSAGARIGAAAAARSQPVRRLSADPETARRVGARHGPPVVFELDAAAMWAEGHTFFRSDNGVWLVDAVPPRFLRRRA